jgi:hypothetical protein
MNRKTPLFIVMLFAFSITIPSSAQSLSFDKFTALGFSGVKNLNKHQDQGFYFSYQGDKGQTKGMYQCVVEVYTTNLEKRNHIIVEAARDANLISVAYNEGIYFLFLKPPTKRNYTFITVDSGGKTIARRDIEKVNDAFGLPEILPLSNGEFLIIENKSFVDDSRTKFITYEIEKVNKNLESLTKMMSPKGVNRDFIILDAIADENRLHLLTQNRIGSDMRNHMILGYDLKKGEEIFQYKLYEGDFSGFPTFIKTNKAGEVVTGGPYYKGGWVDEWSSHGMFSAVIGTDGKQKAMFQTTWKQIQDQVKSDSRWNWYTTRSMVFVEDIYINDDNSFYLIAENVKKMILNTDPNPDTPYKVLTVEDLVLFKFDAEGKFVTIDRVEKQPKEMKIEQSPVNKINYGYMELATMLHKEGLFPYRETIQFKSNPHIVYINPDGMHDKAYFNPLGDTRYSSVELHYSQMDSKFMNAMQNLSGNQKSVYINDYGDVSGGPGSSNGMLTTNQGKILVYQYNPSSKNKTFKIWMEEIPAIN